MVKGTNFIEKQQRFLKDIELYYNGNIINCFSYSFDVYTDYKVDNFDNLDYGRTNAVINKNKIEYDIVFIDKRHLFNFVIEIDDHGFISWYYKQKSKLEDYRETLRNYRDNLVSNAYNDIDKFSVPNPPMLESFKFDDKVIDFNDSHFDMILKYLDKTNKDFLVKIRGDEYKLVYSNGYRENGDGYIEGNRYHIVLIN